ncbi:MAG: hypothetical protein ACI36X_01825 [Bacteroidaceae bacterium]
MSGKGKLTIIDSNASGDSNGKGTYQVYSTILSGTLLSADFTPSEANSYTTEEIDPGTNTSIYLGAPSYKGYIFEITWTPSGGGTEPEAGAPTLSGIMLGGDAVTASGTSLTYTLPYAAADAPLALAYTCSDANTTVTVKQGDNPVEGLSLAVPTIQADGTASSIEYTLVATSNVDSSKSTTYTLTLNRKAADASLKELTVNGRDALPTMTATLASGEATFDLVATQTLGTATVKIELGGVTVENPTGLTAPDYEQSATYTITVTDGTYSKVHTLTVTRAAYLPYQTYYATELTASLNDEYISNVTFPTSVKNRSDSYSIPDGAEGFKTVDAATSYRFTADGGGTLSFQLKGASSVAILVCFRNSVAKFTLSVKEGETEVAAAPAESTTNSKTSEVVEYGAELDVAKTYTVSITDNNKDILAQVRLGISDKTLVTLSGEVTDEQIAELNANASVTCIDLTQCTTVSTATLEPQNPNCLVVTKSGVTLTAAAGKHINQVVYDSATDTYTAKEIQLTDGYDFNNRQAFTAQKVSYKRTFTANTYGTFCLPYAMKVSDLNLAEGEVVERFGSYDAANAQVTFVQLTAEDELQPNTAYLIRNAAEEASAQKTFSLETSTEVPVTANGQGNYFKCNMTTFVMPADENLYKLNSTKNQFTHSAGSAKIPAFRGYLDLSAASGAAVKPAAIRVNHNTRGTGEEGGATAIDDALAASSVWMEEGTLHVAAAEEMLVPVYALDGRLVCWLHVQPNQPASVALERGAYIVAGKKVAW